MTADFHAPAHLAALGLGSTQGDRPFTAHDLSMSPLTIGEISGVIRKAPYRAPRSAHAADWSDIFSYRSAVLDYNAVVCEDAELGAPFVYDFNQTESSSDTAGDTLFRPGSTFTGGVRHRLQLRHFRNGKMRPAPDSQSYFLPFVETVTEDFDGRLTDLHLPTVAGRDAQVHSRFLHRHEDAIRAILRGLFAHVAAGDLRLGAVVDRVVDRSGVVARVQPYIDGESFVVGDMSYLGVSELIEACLQVPSIASSPDPLADHLAGGQDQLPIYSLDMVLVLHAVLGSDWTLHGGVRPVAANGFHLHWGALAMAGCPPVRKGYFASKGKRSRKLFELATAAYGRNETLDFVLAPAAPFLLWSTAGDRGRDEELLNTLIGAVLQSGQEDTIHALSQSEAWWFANQLVLSEGFKRKFRWQDRTSTQGELPLSVPRAPERFAELTFGQANAIAGTLHQLASDIA